MPSMSSLNEKDLETQVDELKKRLHNADQKRISIEADLKSRVSMAQTEAHMLQEVTADLKAKVKDLKEERREWRKREEEMQRQIEEAEKQREARSRRHTPASTVASTPVNRSAVSTLTTPAGSLQPSPMHRQEPLDAASHLQVEVEERKMERSTTVETVETQGIVFTSSSGVHHEEGQTRHRHSTATSPNKSSHQEVEILRGRVRELETTLLQCEPKSAAADRVAEVRIGSSLDGLNGSQVWKGGWKEGGKEKRGGRVTVCLFWRIFLTTLSL